MESVDSLAWEVSYRPGDSSSRVHVLLADLSLEADMGPFLRAFWGIRGPSLKFLSPNSLSIPKPNDFPSPRQHQQIEPTKFNKLLTLFLVSFFPRRTCAQMRDFVWLRHLGSLRVWRFRKVWKGSPTMVLSRQVPSSECGLRRAPTFWGFGVFQCVCSFKFPGVRDIQRHDPKVADAFGCE